MMSFQIGEGSPRLRARTSDAANGGAYASSQRCDMANDLARIWHARKMNDPLTPRFRRSGGLSRWWQVKDSNLRSFRDGFTVRLPLAARATYRYAVRTVRSGSGGPEQGRAMGYCPLPATCRDPTG